MSGPEHRFELLDEGHVGFAQRLVSDLLEEAAEIPDGVQVAYVYDFPGSHQLWVGDGTTEGDHTEEPILE